MGGPVLTKKKLILEKSYFREMGWFTSGPNNPLENVEVPKDQLPAEVEKPKTKKDMNNALAAGAHENFAPMSMSLSQFNKTVQELHNEGNFSTAVETFNLQEKSRQEEYKMKTKERELEIEQLKNHALRENQEHQRQMEKAKFENAK